ncbi:MAG: leucine-rich repeat domain-containing protein [Bacilli bacterium]|nr:leucine-rich repeat domain-containing protein [Clostridia bacterium]MBR4618386.1 leucine-rich repeat domain-containing protein [Bacilli bacterium]
MANKTISELIPVSTVTGDLEVMLDTRNGLKKTTLATLKNYIKTPNNEDKTITENGVYTASVGYDGLGEVTVNVPGSASLQEVKYITTNGIHEADKQEVILAKGMFLNDEEKYHYTGSEPLIGDYIWFQTDNITNLKINDPVYNGKIENDSIIPNFEQALGIITNKQSFKNISVDFDDRETWYVYENGISFIEYEGEIYAKLEIHTKEYATVDIVGDYIWIKGNYTDLNVNSLCYNSTDTTDAVPDLSNSIGHVNNVSILTDIKFDFMDFSYQIVLEYHRIQNYSVYNTIYDGMQRVNVNVPTFEEAKEERNALIRTNLSGAYTIPDELTSVGSYAFANEQLLTSVNLNNTLTLGDHCFYNCKNLETVILNPYINAIPYYAFNGCTALSNIDTSHITYLGDESFQYCTNLQTIDIGSVISFYGYSFYECTNLKDITMPNTNGYSISNYTFYNCTSLKNIDLKQVGWIYDNAFRNCTSLEYIKIGTAINSINSNAFYGCTQSNLTIEFGLTESEFNNRSDLVSYMPWGATNAIILYSDSNAHTLQVNCLNEDIPYNITLEINGKTLNTDHIKQPNNTEITYTVSSRNYITQTNTITLTEDTVIDVTLVADPNPKYYEIDTNLVSWDGANVSIIKNEYTDDSILRITNLNKSENIVINDLDWNGYFSGIGDTSDEFIFTFKINSQAQYFNFDGMPLSTSGSDDGFYLHTSKDGSYKSYYSYLVINYDNASEDWRNNGSICPINETIQMRIRLDNETLCWRYDMNGSNTNAGWNSGTLDPLVHVFSLINDISGENFTIDIDFMNTGFRKNNTWVKRLITERVPKYNLTINSIPATADITINNKRYASGRTIKFPQDSEITYTVSAEDYIAQTNTFTLDDDTVLNITLVADPTVYSIDTSKITITQNTQNYPYRFLIENDNLGNDVILNVVNPSTSVWDYVTQTRSYPYTILLNNDAKTLLNKVLNEDGSDVDYFQMHYTLNTINYRYGSDHQNNGLFSLGIIGQEEDTYEVATTPHEHTDEFVSQYYKYYQAGGSVNYARNEISGRMGYNNGDSQWPHQHETFLDFNGLPTNQIKDCTFIIENIDGTKMVRVKDNQTGIIYSNQLYGISESFRQSYEVIPYLLSSIGWNIFGNCEVLLDLKHTGFKKNNTWIWRPVELQTNHVSLRINTTPSNAKVNINGSIYTSGQLINLPINTEVTWEVSADGYETETNTFTLSENTTLNIVLTATHCTWDSTKLTMQKADDAIFELVQDDNDDYVLLNLYGTNQLGNRETNNPFDLAIATESPYTLNAVAGNGDYLYENHPYFFELKFKILNQAELGNDSHYIPILGSRMADGSYEYDAEDPKSSHGDGITFTTENQRFDCVAFYQPTASLQSSELRGYVDLPEMTTPYSNEWILTLQGTSMQIKNCGNNVIRNTAINFGSYEIDSEFHQYYNFLNKLFQGGYPDEIGANIQIDLKHTGFKDWQGNWLWRPIKVVEAVSPLQPAVDPEVIVPEEPISGD